MPCYEPRLMRCRIDPDSGALIYQYLGAQPELTRPKDLGTELDLESNREYRFQVPCGKCPGCRLDYTRQWANRMILELEESKKALFITLTYRNEDLPIADNGDPTLCKRDVTLWLKRLRKHLSRKDIRIRYYLAGEYGTKTQRPHYHAILFGVSVNDIPDLSYRGSNVELGYSTYSSQTWADLWSHGHILLTEVTAKTCNYVARYVLKKQMDIDDYGFDPHGRIPCYNVSSRKPGIGMKRIEELLDSGISQVTHVDSSGELTIGLPSKALQRLAERYKNEGDYERYSQMQAARADIRKRVRDNLIADVGNGDYQTYLNQKLQGKLRDLRCLPERKY